MQLIYTPRANCPMHVVSFVSGSGGNLAATLAVQDASPDLLHVGMVIADRPGIAAIDMALDRSIPTIVGHFEEQCGVWSECRSDADAAKRYTIAATGFHDRMLDMIRTHERQIGRRFDLAVLSYRRWIHGLLLEYFADRMINQHAGDLTSISEKGERRYVGVNPVWSALHSGETQTRTSTIMVGEGHDTGEIFCQGPWVRYAGGPASRQSAVEHEGRQKKDSDWPSLQFALVRIAQGRYALGDSRHPDGSRSVCLDGVPLAFGGVSIESPSSLESLL